MPRHCQCGCNRKVRKLADRFATRACKAKDKDSLNAERNEAAYRRWALNITSIFRKCGFDRFIVNGLDLADPGWSALE
jgi:hypothetical protein